MLHVIKIIIRLIYLTKSIQVLTLKCQNILKSKLEVHKMYKYFNNFID